MNFLFIGGFSFRDGGGVGRVSRSLAAEFIRQGHECSFLGTRLGEDTIIEGVPQFFLPGAKVSCRENQKYLKKLVGDREIRLIINQTGFNEQSFNLLESACDQCVVLTVHHNCVACLQDMHQSIINYSLSRLQIPAWARPKWLLRLFKARSRSKTARCIERISRQGDGIVLLAEPFKSELSVFTERIDLDRVFAIPNPCPFVPDVTALAEKEKSVLYVGRLENGQKRVDRLLDIWSSLSKRFPDWRLDIVGDGTDAGALKEQANKMKLKRLFFHGKSEPVPFYRKASVLLLPSDFEGFGMVLVEAQAFGCIPIASDCFSSVRSVLLDGDSGFVVPPAKIQAYVDKSSLVMEGSEAVATMQRSAVAHAEDFHPVKVYEAWMRCIETVVDKKKLTKNSPTGG